MPYASLAPGQHTPGGSCVHAKTVVACPLWRMATRRPRRSLLHRCNCSVSNEDGQGRIQQVMSITRASVEKTLRKAGFHMGTDPSAALMANSPAVLLPNTSSYSWEEWQQIFDAVDHNEAKAASLKEKMAKAVRQEDYAEAAARKEQLASALGADVVHQAFEELNAAVQEERYGDAAVIRDTTAVGLVGWWAGGTEDDPCGHVLHITRDFGRLTARAYTPSNLAEMKGWTEENPLRQDEQLLAAPPVNLGQRVMEIYLQKNSAGQWEQQAVVLQDSKLSLRVIDELEDTSLTANLQTISEGSILSPGSPVDESEPTVRHPASLLHINRNQFMVVPDNPEDKCLSSYSGSSASGLRVSSSSLGQDKTEFTVVADGSDSSVSIPFEDFIESLGDEDPDGTWSRVADAVAEMQERISADGMQEISRAELAAGIRDAIEKLVEGGIAGDSLAVEFGQSPDVDSISQAVIKPATYNRIMNDGAAADLLSGLYLGAFGPHGPEVLKLARTECEDGTPMVEGVKITGDQNVPAGQISFRAKVGKRHKLRNDGTYPEELGVTARYQGEGCVAQPGFQNPKWVDGELLVFSGSSSSLSGSVTGGAELGFVWSMPDDKKFLILMNRVNIDDLISSSCG